jgi:uncharacterized protein YkwD
MDSPGHRRVMLEGRYRQAGVGITLGSPYGPTTDGVIYTADFGYRR